MTVTEYRELTERDAALLEQATLGNVNWCGDRFTLAQLRDTEALAHYTRLVPERGDFGVLTHRRGDVVGVAWGLFLPRQSPGYAFIDERTPEVSLWVDATHRRQGHGRALLRGLADAALRRHIARLSLSVETGNLARDLYASEGFVPVPGRETEGVMLKMLEP